jgi:hypothetical protein
MPDKVGSSPALRNEADPEHYHGEAFSPLAPWRSHAHRCQTPLSPMRVRPPEHASCVGGYLQAWRRHRSWRVGRPKLGLASKAVRKEAVCELTGTIEGKRSRDEGEGGDRVAL